MGKKNKSLERVTFLAEKFNVFTNEDFIEYLKEDNHGYLTVMSEDDVPIALYKTKRYDDGSEKLDDNHNVIVTWIGIYENVFIDIVQSDPTVNKAYVQWMLTTLTRYIKTGDIEKGIMFAVEDLPLAEEYLHLFESNKFKKSFKEMCKANYVLNKIKDSSNINQYKNLSQLFDAVDPFIIRDISQLEKGMEGFVKRGMGEIPFKDRRFTIFIPKTKHASGLFNNFASWCTVKSSSTMFDSYTSQKTSFNDKSRLYIVIDNNFFLEDDDPKHSNGIWQIHFESGQIMDKSNRNENNFKEKVLDKSDGASEYFYDLLINFARAKNTNLSKNIYVKRLINFGFVDIMFEILDPDSHEIQFIDKTINKLPDMSRFKNLIFLYLNNVKLLEIDKSIGKLSKLGTLSLPNNRLTEIPKGICYLNKLASINLVGNKIKTIPDELGKLDRQNGGNLVRICFTEGDISKDNLDRVRKLLPTTDVVEIKKPKK